MYMHTIVFLAYNYVGSFLLTHNTGTFLHEYREQTASKIRLRIGPTMDLYGMHGVNMDISMPSVSNIRAGRFLCNALQFI